MLLGVLAAGLLLWSACGDSKESDGAAGSPTGDLPVLVAETPTRAPEPPTATATPTPTRIVQAVEATPTPVPGDTTANVWDGTYEGTVVWDCGAAGTHEGTLAGEFTINVDGTAATLDGQNTVTGSCSDSGTITVNISVPGERTADGFIFPADLWGRPGDLVIEVSGREGSGRLEGEIAGPAVLSLDFEVRAR